MLGNTPRRQTDFYLERGKSFVLTVEFLNDDGTPFDVSGSQVRIAAVDSAYDGTAPTLLTRTAEPVDPAFGTNAVRFEFQASDLDIASGSYLYDITLLHLLEYSVPILKGLFVIGSNADKDTTNVFDDASLGEGVVVTMGSSNGISIVIDTIPTLKGDKGDKGDTGDAGAPAVMYFQPEQPDSNSTPVPAVMWVDTDAMEAAPSIGELLDVSAPADTPAGKVLGTVATGQWGPVDASVGGGGGGVSQAYVDAGDAANSAETQVVADELALVEDALQDVKVWAGDPTPLHVNSTLSEWLSDLADEVHHLSARPAFSLDGILHVDLHNGFARVFATNSALESGEKWVEFELATSPQPGGAIPSGTNAVAVALGTVVRAGGVQGPVVGATGGAVSPMALANYISQNRICRVLYDLSNPVRPTLTILETLDAIPTGTSALHLGALYDVTALADTPAGKVLGTTAVGTWGPVDPPAGGGTPYLVVNSLDDIPPGTPAGTLVVLSVGAPPPVTKPAVVGSTSSSHTGTSSGTVTLVNPPETLAGDWLVAFVCSQSSAIATDFVPPAGWTRAGWPFQANDATFRYNSLWIKKAEGSSETHIWTAPITTSRLTAAMFVIRGANDTTPVGSFSALATATDNTKPALPIISAPKEQCLALAMIHTVTAANNDPGITLPAPWVTDQHVKAPSTWVVTGAGDALLIASQEMGTSTTVGGELGTVAGPACAADASAVVVIQP